MISMKPELKEDYAFHFLENIDIPVVQLISIGKQIRSSNSYYFDNQYRLECYLFQYTLNGSGCLKINGEEYLIKKNDGFLLKLPGDECYYFNESKNDGPWEFIYIMFKGAPVAPYYDYIKNHLGTIITLFPQYQAINNLMQLHNDVQAGRIENPFLLSSKVFEFLCHLCALQRNNDENLSPLVLQAKEFMKKEYTNPLGIKAVADFLNISHSHLSRIFFAETGTHPIDFLTKIRLEEAIKLMNTTSMKMEELSTVCGFSCGNYFNKVFKKHMNMTPSQFRSYIKQEGYSKIQI